MSPVYAILQMNDPIGHVTPGAAALRFQRGPAVRHPRYAMKYGEWQLTIECSGLARVRGRARADLFIGGRLVPVAQDAC